VPNPLATPEIPENSAERKIRVNDRNNGVSSWT
jgi:hypothetical protein